MLRVLYLSPSVNQMSVGEAYVAYKWAEALSEKVKLTILTFKPVDTEHARLLEALPNVELVTWPTPNYPKSLSRFVAMFKPTYPLYKARVRRWLRQAQAEGREFDLAHQIMPQAARYSSPLTGSGIPYILSLIHI